MSRQSSSTTRRTGFVLICVMACLAVVSSILVSITRTSIRNQRESRVHRQMEQTRWLLDAGINRAMKQLAESPTYRGETWQPTLALPKYRVAVVKISISPSDNSTTWILEVTASLSGASPSTNSPSLDPHRTQQRYRTTITVSDSSTGETKDDE